MAKYQITLVVEVEADTEHGAHTVADELGSFLGMHFKTTTLGSVTDVSEVDDAASDEDFDEDEDYLDEGGDTDDGEALASAGFGTDEDYKHCAYED
jgi:hypothetical protein